MTLTRPQAAGLQTARLAEIPPLTLTLLQADLKDAAAVRELNELHDYAHERSFGERGERWRGRRPKGNEPGAGLDESILRQLYMEDHISPCMNKIVSAIIGRDFEWQAFEDGKELSNEDEIVVALTEYHREARLHVTAKKAARIEQWSGRNGGRAFIPEEYAAAILTRTPTTLADALEFVHVAPLDPREGGPLRDRHGRTIAFYFTWEERHGALRRRFVELHTPDTIYTLERQGVRLIPAERGEGIEWTVPNPYRDVNASVATRRAQFLMFTEDRDGGSAITRTVRDMHDGLCKARTGHSRNDDLAAFRSYVTTNAETPKDDAGNPAPWTLGPQMAANVVGIPKDESIGPNGTDILPTRHTPTFQVIDPLNPELSTLPSISDWRRAVLRAWDQLWTEAADELQISGKAQAESRKAFDQRVIMDSANTALWCAWALKAALTLAAHLTDRQELIQRAARITFVPTLFLDVQIGDLEEFKTLIDAWKNGMIRLETALRVAPGVTDAAAEVEALQEEQAAPPPEEAVNE